MRKFKVIVTTTKEFEIELDDAINIVDYYDYEDVEVEEL